MNPSLAVHGAMAVDLNSPGRYLNWSIFTISVANLVLIAVMVVIFGIALLAPFPGRRHGSATTAQPGPGAAPEFADQVESADAADHGYIGASGDDADARMWTARVRRWALRVLPPGKLLPDRQPAYVASWVYVFGVATLAALAWRSSAGSPSRSAAPTGGTPTRSVTSSTACTCGASSCSWRSWSSTCGASSGWPPGAGGARSPGSPAWSRSSPRSWSASPGTCRSRTSTRSGSRPTARTRSTRRGSARSST